MSFTQDCIQDSLPVWEACLDSLFLKELAGGTLDPACFIGYIVDDSLYLREYAKVFAWGMLKAKNMKDIRACYSMISFANEEEDATRLRYLKSWGLTDDGIQTLPQRPENRAYTDYMIAAARDGEGMLECMMACLPCMISYCWIFRKLLERTPSIRETPFWALVRDYTADGYDAACRKWGDYTDTLFDGHNAGKRERMMKIFHQCSLYELDFWKMSAKPRTDIPVFSKSNIDFAG
ncbi:MAG: TENA/THI-4 family protein [Clostridiales bacterium]|nr:TENA/THI-4 family protein [Clostridiales bacterium]